MIDTLKENRRLIGVSIVVYWYLAEYQDVPYPWEIDETALFVSAGVVAAIVGYFAAGIIFDMFPDPEGIYLVAFEANDETGGSVWELSEDQFSSMDVHAGTLFEWPVAKRVYECREYRPEENVAVANWRESVAASELAGNVQVVDALEAIAELREEFELEAMKARHLKRRLRTVARTIDRRRLEDMESILDPTLTPTFEDDQASISSILESELPEDLKPETMKGEDIDTETNGEGETIGFELLDEAEALEIDDA